MTARIDETPCDNGSTGSLPCILFLCILPLQYGLLAWHAFQASPVHDEFGHFYAGIAFWKFGDVELFNVNPPFVRALGTVPALFSDLPSKVLRVDWQAPDRPEFLLGRKLFLDHRHSFESALFRGRLLVSLFAVFGTVVLFLWGRHLSNDWGGLCAATLWAFQPQILGHGSLITNDVPVAVMLAAFAYALTRWLDQRSLSRAIVMAFALGLALICKFTALIAIPLFILFVLATTRRHQLRITSIHIVLVGAVCWFIIAGTYRFVDLGKPLGEFDFISLSLGREEIPRAALAGSRFRGTWLGYLPVLVPAPYLQGIDRQQFDFDRKLSSYALGMNKHGSWWWFYLYAMLVKLPVGTWLAILFGLTTLFWHFGPMSHSVAAPVTFVACLLFVISAKAGIGQQVRYIVPAYPFLFVLVAPSLGHFRRVDGDSRAFALVFPGVLLMACLLSVGESLRAAPHWLPFFNGASGGSLAGYRHLYGDATDWEQSRDSVVRWLKEHPQHRPAFLVSDSMRLDEMARTMDGVTTAASTEVSMIPAGTCWLIVSQTALSRRSAHPWLWKKTAVDSISAAHLVYCVDGRDWLMHLDAVPEFWPVTDESKFTVHDGGS